MGTLSSIKKNTLSFLKKQSKENPAALSLYKFIKAEGIKHAYFWTMKNYFKYSCGYDLNLSDPKGFNEKIQWIKVYHHDPLMTQCADKYRVRSYIKEKIRGGTNLELTKIYGTWEDPEKIPFDTLPDQFVLKSNHASGQVIIIKDKKQLNRKEAVAKMKQWLKENFYYATGEWVYKDIKPLIICEELLDDDIKDYKFYCFNGEPKFLYVSEGLAKSHDQARMNYLTLDWKKTPFQRKDYIQFENLPHKPVDLDNMIQVAKDLSQPFPFVRVDLYSIKGKTIFSELTFYPNAGFQSFYPMEWEYKIGEWLKLKR